MSRGHFQTSTMDAAKVHLECLPVLKSIRMQTATIKSDPGAREPLRGMDCANVTVGRFLVSKMPPTALCQANIVLGGGTSFHPFEVLAVRAQAQRDVLPLNKIGEMPSIPFGDEALV